MDATVVKLERLIDFFKAGIAADPKHYDPEDVAAEMAALEAILAEGLNVKHLNSEIVIDGVVQDNAVTTAKIADGAVTGAKLAASLLRLLPFAGLDGSGVDPELTCTLTGALLGDTVAAIIDTADFSDARSLFATEIAVAAEIEQLSLTDLSAKTYLALLVKE